MSLNRGGMNAAFVPRTVTGALSKTPLNVIFAGMAAFSTTLNQSRARCETIAASCPPEEVPLMTKFTGSVCLGTRLGSAVTIYWNASHPSLIGIGYGYAGQSRYSTLITVMGPPRAMYRHETADRSIFSYFCT